MSYEGCTFRHDRIQDDIDYEKDWEWQDIIASKIKGEPWRLVDNREAYIEKRMRLEGLK